ncbi:hybrid sensor histidine kinase/response regulator transcription factor [Flagellimonas myxillae]|uniref:hybrid sensor histidine kinase/response regulator transcription factor n=1 Tax=Flagellimonas myxillae TaxID=2942214 RepID=UPI00201F173E|nr:two-component regulator propeller domain-containing protein [Muricauda myxillae]MCL6266327.1 response regulator [Muricauda myxillae]
MIRSVYLSGIVFWVSVLCSFGQSQPVFDKIDRTNGLSNNRINSIVKESEGFVWIGTNNGLNRYDGLDIKIYNQQNSNLASNDITDILIDSTKKMWIATSDGGLHLYDNISDDFDVFRSDPNDKTSIPSNKINVLYEDSKGNIWIGTENGFCLFDKESKKFISWLNSFSSGVTCFLETERGLLIGTFGDGLKFYNQENQILEDILWDNANLNFIHTIAKFDNNEFLVGTSGSGLLLLDIEGKRVSDFLGDQLSNEKSVKIIRTIRRDKDGDFWIGTDGDGLMRINNPNGDNPTVARYVHNSQVASSLSGNAIFDIFIDVQTNIWVGTAWNGINYLSRTNNFNIILSDIEGESTSPVLSIYKTSDKLLMGLDGKGLTIHESPSGTTHLLKENDLGASYVQHIMEATDGTLWLGTFTRGLINIDSNGRILKSFNNENEHSALKYNDIRYIVEDHRKNFWIASWEGGLSYLDTETNEFAHYTKQSEKINSLSSNNIVSLAKDGRHLWIATFGGGINLLDTKTKKFRHFRYEENNENSISSDNTFSLLKDSRGFLWIGTAGNGVNRYDPKEDCMERFDHDEVIRYASVVSIVEDNHGKIWFGTKDGVFNFDYDKYKFSSFPSLHDEFHINSSFVDSTGTLYFGGLQGVTSFNPDEISNTSASPEIVITDFKLFNKSLPIEPSGVLDKSILLTDKLSLKYNQDVVTFNFSALQFPFASRMEYAIKMENFDPEWRNIGEERSATYTNLRSGDYIFRVIGREKGMDWGDNEASIEVEVLKPLWFEWWAYFLYAMLLLFILYWLRRYTVAWERMKANLRLEQITNEKNEEVHNIKQRFFMNISHEIRTPLTLIMGALNGLGKEALSLKDQKRLKTVNKNASRLMNLMEELLNFRKLESGSINLEVSENDVVGFIREIYLAFGQQAIDNAIDFQFVATNDTIWLWFDKRQLEKTVVNLVSNAFKFTPVNGKIKIEISTQKKQVRIRVSDTGDGIPEEKLSKIFNRFYQNSVTEKSGFGIGLSIAYEIIKLHSGEIKVDSIEGKGSEFTILLPTGRNHFPKESIVLPSSQQPIYSLEDPEDIDELLEMMDSDPVETVLIVEDHEELRGYVRGVLEAHYKVIEASNGENGLKVALKQIPDLIISDIMMPGMDGMKFCRSLKSSVVTSHIPIILLTALSSMDDKLRGYEIGADDYVTKPFSEELLLAKVKSLLHNRELIRRKFNTDGLLLPRDLALNSTDQGFLEKLTELIETHLDAPDFGANQLSREMGMSHSVLYKKIKALSGMNMVEFIRDYKLRIAKKLLENQSNSVTEVCYKVGYSDRKYFSKLFKQRFGVPPSSFLRKTE